MIHGSSQARTARRAAGQERRGRGASLLLLLPPAPRLVGDGFGLDGQVAARGGAAVVVPAKREGAADEGPVPPDGEVRADLIATPAQGCLGLLVALLHPHPQAIESDDLRQVGGRQRSLLLCPRRPGSRQIGGQIPGGAL